MAEAAGGDYDPNFSDGDFDAPPPAENRSATLETFDDAAQAGEDEAMKEMRRAQAALTGEILSDDNDEGDEGAKKKKKKKSKSNRIRLDEDR